MKRTNHVTHKLPLACALLSTLFFSTSASAQRGGPDWNTTGSDAQRSNWVRADAKISRETMAKPGFEMVWKMQLENAPRQLNSVTPPALIDFYIGYRGFRALGFFALASDRVIGVDIDLARKEWEKKLTTAAAPAGSIGCPGGLTSAVARPTGLAYPAGAVPRGFGRGGAAKSGVGAPHEGAVTLRQTNQQPNFPPRPPQNTKRGPGGAPPAAAPNPFSPRVQWVMALASDGKLHRMYISNGEEPLPAIPFLPAGANASGLIVIDNVAYVSTSNSCNGVDNGVWALDIESAKVNHWKAPGKGIAGTAGPAFGPDGVIYVTAGSELTALDPKSLAVKGSYKTGGAEFTSSPLVFEFKGKDIVAAVASDGSVHLVDGATLSAVGKGSVAAAANYATGALSSWQDESGTRWILVPANGNVQALKVVDKGGSAAVEAGWTSRALTAPVAPIVVNGVVFALSSGEFRTADDKVTAAQRAQRSTPAVLYALDGVSGKELWSSGKSITSFVHSGVLASDHNMVFVAGHDGTQYSFAFPMEH